MYIFSLLDCLRQLLPGSHPQDSIWSTSGHQVAPNRKSWTQQIAHNAVCGANNGAKFGLWSNSRVHNLRFGAFQALRCSKSQLVDEESHGTRRDGLQARQTARPTGSRSRRPLGSAVITRAYPFANTGWPEPSYPFTNTGWPPFPAAALSLISAVSTRCLQARRRSADSRSA